MDSAFAPRDETDAPRPGGQGLVERLLKRHLGRLKRHAGRDAALVFLPPVLVFFYLGNLLYRSVLLRWPTLMAAGAAVILAAVALGIARFRRHSVSQREAARLLDARAQAEDRFVTLATVDRSSCPPTLLDRLRREAGALLHRIDLRRDFPYRLKRSFAASAIASLIAFILFHVFLEVWLLFSPQARTASELAILAHRLSETPGFSEVGHELRTLAEKISENGIDAAADRVRIEAILARLEGELHAAGRQRGVSGGLDRIADALRQAGQKASGGEDQGNREARVPGGGDGGIEKSAGSGANREQALSTAAGGTSKAAGAGTGSPERGPMPRDQKRSDHPQVGRGSRPDSAGEALGEARLREEGGRQEDLARGEPPERFFEPGTRGDKRIKGARFVTVRLPEEEAEAQPGEGGSAAGRSVRAKVPVSNVPLRRPDSPEPSAEKQPVPLEYRERIR
jgi:hypothetical protein